MSSKTEKPSQKIPGEFIWHILESFHSEGCDEAGVICSRICNFSLETKQSRLHTFTLDVFIVHVHQCLRTREFQGLRGGQKTTLWTQYAPSTFIWVPRTRVNHQTCVVNALTC